MKTIKCEYCSREREVEDNIRCATCPCGNSFTFSNDTTKDDQVIIKSVFNRGVNKGRQYAQDLIDDLK
jgi:hypothetical protein